MKEGEGKYKQIKDTSTAEDESKAILERDDGRDPLDLVGQRDGSSCGDWVGEGKRVSGESCVPIGSTELV
jgi:hypothetical protein